jgi:hypothetical protein
MALTRQFTDRNDFGWLGASTTHCGDQCVLLGIGALWRGLWSRRSG